MFSAILFLNLFYLYYLLPLLIFPLLLLLIHSSSSSDKDNIILSSIKSGLVYEGKKFKKSAKKIYYPGEVIFSNIPITKPSFCEHIIGKNVDQLLVRPIELYEFPNSKSIKKIFGKTSSIESILNLENKATYLYWQLR